jgi:hypothetical protein
MTIADILEKHYDAFEGARRYLASGTPEDNRRTVAFIRQILPSYTGRQREILEEMAERFEERACVAEANDQKSIPSPSSRTS